LRSGNKRKSKINKGKRKEIKKKTSALDKKSIN